MYMTYTIVVSLSAFFDGAVKSHTKNPKQTLPLEGLLTIRLDSSFDTMEEVSEEIRREVYQMLKDRPKRRALGSVLWFASIARTIGRRP
jgi:hypothetical protein